MPDAPSPPPPMPRAAHARKKYLVVFAALAVLTLLEVGVAQVLKHERGVMVSLLVLLALAKAGAVALFYMHLADERRGLRLLVGVPLMIPPLLAVTLLLEALARFPGN